jgi:hypothetical protein
MSTLLIARSIEVGSFGTNEWAEKEYAIPLVLQEEGARVSIFIEKGLSFAEIRGRKVNVFPRGRMELYYDPAPNLLLSCLVKKQNISEGARQIYRTYKGAMTKLEGLLLSAGDQRHLYWVRTLSEEDFFDLGDMDLGDGVTWSADSGDRHRFKPKLPKERRLNPMYKRDQLLTFAKWKRMQDAATNGEIPTGEMFELYRIRVKAQTFEPKVAAIEASIISETLLREYSLGVLQVRGFSRAKLKQISDDLTFNYLLNVLLPLSLSKSEFNRIARSVQQVDSLRKLRNDIVHGNIKDSAIEREIVANGVESAIRLVEFLKKRLPVKAA